MTLELYMFGVCIPRVLQELVMGFVFEQESWGSGSSVHYLYHVICVIPGLSHTQSLSTHSPDPFAHGIPCGTGSLDTHCRQTCLVWALLRRKGF